MPVMLHGDCETTPMQMFHQTKTNRLIHKQQREEAGHIMSWGKSLSSSCLLAGRQPYICVFWLNMFGGGII